MPSDSDPSKREQRELAEEKCGGGEGPLLRSANAAAAAGHGGPEHDQGTPPPLHRRACSVFLLEDPASQLPIIYMCPPGRYRWGNERDREDGRRCGEQGQGNGARGRDRLAVHWRGRGTGSSSLTHMIPCTPPSHALHHAWHCICRIAPLFISISYELYANAGHCTGVVRGPDKWHGRAAGDPCAERPHHGSGLHSAGTDPAQLAGGRATVINPRRASGFLHQDLHLWANCTLPVLPFQSRATGVVVDFSEPSAVYDNVKQVRTARSLPTYDMEKDMRAACNQ